MKRFYLIAIALCFVIAGYSDSFAQTSKKAKKPVRQKLVKCYENGKRVYRKKCRKPQITNPTLEIKPTEKVQRDEKTREIPSGVLYGTGGGQGSGDGTGNGRGSGYGNGAGSGIRNGNTPEQTTPNGNNSNIGPTVGLKLLSKPSPQYTDAARQNNVQGSIRLRVTFLANGTIGSISPINSLPNGLTEQAIAAARRIKFEPAKRNGIAVNTTKTIQYNFSIY